jgi:predicted DNA-binding transcriptional regulator YafY
LSTLHQAVLEDRWVRATFNRAHDIRSVRRIAPYGLVAKATTWYLVWAGEDAQLRVDRLARILDVELESETYARPEAFDLAEFWKG